MINYYELFEINENFTKKELKMKYRKLILKFHPDKNKNISTKDFINVCKGYEILNDDNKRKIYDYQLKYNLDENDIIYLYNIYDKFTNSNEFKLCKIIYNSLPENVKSKVSSIKKRFLENDKIIKSSKFIDIRYLNHDYTIILNVKSSEIYKFVLKKIIIYSKDCVYYLFLRFFNKNILLKNGNCYLNLKFKIINDIYLKKNDDLVIHKYINLYQYLFKKNLSIILPDNSNIYFDKIELNHSYEIKNKGFYKDYKNKGNCNIIFHLKSNNNILKYENIIKEIFDN